MPLQNRVDPFGDIHAVTERGLFTGNRGIIHDPATKTLVKKRWTTKAWIICACDFQDRRREPMGRNGVGDRASWTELFFLDEVTALAAGHRPCFFCQREKAKAFAAAFGTAFGIAAPRAPDIDARLHRERLASGGSMVELDRQGLGLLPDGAVIFDGQYDYAIRGGEALRWSFGGYDRAIPFANFGPQEMCVVTPATTIAVLSRGYRPVWHPTAEAGVALIGDAA
jgi:hypothetical protein